MKDVVKMPKSKVSKLLFTAWYDRLPYSIDKAFSTIDILKEIINILEGMHSKWEMAVHAWMPFWVKSVIFALLMLRKRKNCFVSQIPKEILYIIFGSLPINDSSLM
eukprot:TRINITY_DN16126_c0_g1_i1.p1 TRINITY_DN16126_c0_g1~~TRINITY_DN16126_c0_g1_i1.p1  ORF type:complete len:106 (-),score=3.80 TRINITY_DN16126_c0_g1_i1:39-356(-)